MKACLSPLLRFFSNLLFPPPPHKQNLPQEYDDFINQLSPRPRFSGETTYFLSYKDPSVKNLIEELKRYNNTRLFTFMGKLIASYLEEASLPPKQIYIITIPQTKNRLKERGYDVTKNTTQSIIEHTSTDQFINGSDFLIHNRTQHQSAFTQRAERLTAAKGMFRVKKNLQNVQTGSLCIIVDDVCTTGASLKEAQSILEESGFVILKKITLAHS